MSSYQMLRPCTVPLVALYLGKDPSASGNEDVAAHTACIKGDTYWPQIPSLLCEHFKITFGTSDMNIGRTAHDK